MERCNRLSRPFCLFMAATVAVVTLAVLVPATHAVVLGPNAASFSYSLASGADSAPFTPVSDRAVLVMGTQTAVGNRGVGFVTLLHPSVAPLFLEWTGLESTAGSAIAQGFSGIAGTHIVFLDFAHQVDIRVASPNTFLVHNKGAGTQTGNVTIIW